VTAAAPDPFPFWLTILSNLPVSDSNSEPVPSAPVPYFVVGGDSAGDYATLGASAAPGGVALWRITPDGRILCGALGGLLLGLDQNGTPQVQTEASPASASQRWNIVPTSAIGVVQIQNQGTAGYLYVQAGSPPQLVDGTYLATSPTPTDDTFEWAFSPTAVLATLLAQPPTPWVAFVDGPGSPQGQMYAAICAACHPPVGDLRAQYTSVTFNCVIPTIEPPCPVGVAQSDWDAAWTAVSAQLQAEVDLVIVVQKFFSTWSTKDVGLLAQGIATTLQAIADTKLDVKTDNTSVGAILLSIFETIVYTTISGFSAGAGKGADVGLSVLANLIQGAISCTQSGLANSGPNLIPADPVQTTIAELWTNVVSTSEALDNVLNTAVHTILSDWGMLQVGAELMTVPNSLSMDYLALSPLLDAATAGQFVAVMQALMPVKYQIYNPGADKYSPSSDDVPSWAWIGSRYIAGISKNTTFPAQKLMDDLVGYGVALEDIAAGNRGWGLAEAVNGPASDAQCTVRLVNNTPYQMTVGASIWVSLTASSVIPPGESLTFMAMAPAQGRFSMTTLDGVVAASFNVTYYQNPISGCAASVGPVTLGPGYTANTPLSNDASIGDGGFSLFKCYSAAVVFSLSYAPGS
jgi:hypothetical protein